MGHRPWGCKESDMTERLHFTSLHEWCKSALILEKHFLMQENKTVVTAKSYHLCPGTGVVGIK